MQQQAVKSAILQAMSVRVCHITTVHPVYDGRIFFKECVSLAQAEFEVHLLAPNTHDHKRDGVDIHNMNIPAGRLGRFLMGNIMAFSRALRLSAEVYHFHDPELIPGMLFLRLFGKSVIYDVHENLPAQIESKSYLGPMWIRKLVSLKVAIIENLAAQVFSAIVTVIPEIGMRFPTSKTVILRNLPRISLIESALSDRPVPTENRSKTLVYAGGLSEIRGIKECIEALEILADAEVKLLLIGRWSNDEYFHTCRKMDGWRYVDYLGEKPVNEVYGHLRGASIGLCLLYPEPNYLVSLPVKAFEYMTMGIPILMSDFPYWCKTFTGCAMFADPHNPTAIADCIREMLRDKKHAEDMGNKGKSLVYNELSWEKEAQKLIALYAKILER
jgi:glycosyltransferase involved in cell wall biosynthesis